MFPRNPLSGVLVCVRLAFVLHLPTTFLRYPCKKKGNHSATESTMSFLEENLARFETCGVCGDSADPERIDRTGFGNDWWNDPVVEIAPQQIDTRALPNGNSVFITCPSLTTYVWVDIVRPNCVV